MPGATIDLACRQKKYQTKFSELRTFKTINKGAKMEAIIFLIIIVVIVNIILFIFKIKHIIKFMKIPEN